MSQRTLYLVVRIKFVLLLNYVLLLLQFHLPELDQALGSAAHLKLGIMNALFCTARYSSFWDELLAVSELIAIVLLCSVLGNSVIWN